MSQWIDGDYKTLTSGEAISPFRILHLASSVLTMSEYAETMIGVSIAYTATASPCTFKLLTGAGTFKIEAAGDFSQGAVLYGRSNGTVDDVSDNSALKVGIALEAATASGDIVEVLPHVCTT